MKTSKADKQTLIELKAETEAMYERLKEIKAIVWRLGIDGDLMESAIDSVSELHDNFVQVVEERVHNQ